MQEIIEYKDGLVTIKKCNKCDVTLENISHQEGWTYFIGNHQIQVTATILRGRCPKCHEVWESEDARKDRNEAFVKAIDNWWRHQLDELDVAHEDLTAALHVTKVLMSKLGKEKRRQVSAEFGRWLADCSFIGN